MYEAIYRVDGRVVRVDESTDAPPESDMFERALAIRCEYRQAVYYTLHCDGIPVWDGDATIG